MGVVIENPILNSPYDEPTRHWKVGEDGITDEIVEKRRLSSYFIPIPPSGGDAFVRDALRSVTSP